MKIQSEDFQAIKPFLKHSYPSFRIRPNGSFTIMGLIDGQQFIVEGGLNRSRSPQAGLYCVEAAKEGVFKASSATPAPPESRISPSLRNVTEVAAFEFPEVSNADSFLSLAMLKDLARWEKDPYPFITPFAPNGSEGNTDNRNHKVKYTSGGYGGIHFYWESKPAIGDTYFLNFKVLACLPNHSFDCSITEQQILIMESKRHGYYFLTCIEKVGPDDSDLSSRDEEIVKLRAEMKSFD